MDAGWHLCKGLEVTGQGGFYGWSGRQAGGSRSGKGYGEEGLGPPRPRSPHQSALATGGNGQDLVSHWYKAPQPCRPRPVIPLCVALGRALPISLSVSPTHTGWETHLRKLCQLPDLLSLLEEVLVWENCAVLSRSVVSNSLRAHGLQSTRLLCPWGFSRQEYWSGLPCPPPEDLPTPGIEPRSPPCRWILYHLSQQGSPVRTEPLTKRRKQQQQNGWSLTQVLGGQGPRPGQPHNEPLDPGPCLRLRKWLAGGRPRLSRRKGHFPSKLPGTWPSDTGGLASQPFPVKALGLVVLFPRSAVTNTIR